MIRQPHSKKELICKCGIKTYEQDGICAVCKVMAEVEIKCGRLEVGNAEARKG